MVSHAFYEVDQSRASRRASVRRTPADWGDDRLPSRRDPAALSDRAGRRSRRGRDGGGPAAAVPARVPDVPAR